MCTTELPFDRFLKIFCGTHRNCKYLSLSKINQVGLQLITLKRKRKYKHKWTFQTHHRFEILMYHFWLQFNCVNFLFRTLTFALNTNKICKNDQFLKCTCLSDFI